jgi:hypothetical protein
MLRNGDSYTCIDGSISTWNLPPVDPANDKAILDQAKSSINFFITEEGMSFEEAIDRINGLAYLSNNQIGVLSEGNLLLPNSTCAQLQTNKHMPPHINFKQTKMRPYKNLTELQAHEREEIKRLNKEFVKREEICKQYSISANTFYEITRENHNVY